MSESVSISKHSCKICEFKTTKLKKYNDHVQSHGEKGHLLCLICDFVTLKPKRFEKHIKTHASNTGHEYNSINRNNVAPETDTSQYSSSNKNSLLTHEQLKVGNKPRTVTQPAESAKEKDPQKHKSLKVNHHLNSNPKLQQHSCANIQTSPRLEQLTTKTYLNHSPSTKGSFRSLATGKDECFENSEEISPTSVGRIRIKYSCPVCDFGTKKKIKYKDHVKLHQKEGQLFCSLCDFVSLNGKRLKKHLRAHKNNLWANISSVQLTNKDTLLNLEVPPLPLNILSVTRSDSDETVFKESAAVQLSEGDSKLLRRKAKKNVNAKKTFCCSVCNYQTQHKHHFTEHTRIHTGDRPFSCTYSGCSYSSAKKCNLTTHMALRHSKEKPYSCQLCGDRFQNKRFFNSHVRNHEGKKPICCTYKGCEFSCASSSDLKKHIRTHTFEKPHHCYYVGCEYSCSRKFALKAHFLTHTGDRPYHCTFKNCNYSAINSRNLKTHIFTHTMVQPLHCDFNDCKFACAQSVYLKLHMMQHLTQNPYSCPKCKFRSRTVLEIEQHLETHHTLQNTSNDHHLQPSAPIKKSPAESVTSILNVQTQPSFSSLNYNETYSETRDEARPIKKHVCARCDFHSKSHKKYKAHVESHVEERQLSKRSDSKLKKHKRNSKQGSDISSTPRQGNENSTAILLLKDTKKSLGSFACNFCKKSFAKEIKLLNHLRCHTGQKMHGL